MAIQFTPRTVPTAIQNYEGDISTDAKHIGVTPATSNSAPPLLRQANKNYAAQTGVFPGGISNGLSFTEDRTTLYWHLASAGGIRKATKPATGNNFTMDPNWLWAINPIRRFEVTPDGQYMAAIGTANASNYGVYIKGTDLVKNGISLVTTGTKAELKFSPLNDHLVVTVAGQAPQLYYKDAANDRWLQHGNPGFIVDGGNSGVAFHGTGELVVLAQNLGSSPGLHVYRRNDKFNPASGYTYLGRTSIFDNNAFTISCAGVTFLNWGGRQDYLLGFSSESPFAGRIWRWNAQQNIFQYQPDWTAGLPAVTQTKRVYAANKAATILLFGGGSPTPLNAYDFPDYLTGRITAQDLPGYDFNATVNIGIEVGGSGDLPFADLDIVGNIGTGGYVQGDLPFVDMDVAVAKDEDFPPEQFVLFEPAQVFIGPVPARAYDQTPGQFAYVHEADLPFADLEATGGVIARATVEGDLPFGEDDLAALVFQKIEGAADGDIPWSDLAIEIAYDRREASVEGDMPFADLAASGLLGALAEVSGDLPFADLDIQAETGRVVEVAADLPFAELAIQVKYERRATVAGDIPGFDFAALADVGVPVYVEADLPFADLDVFAGYPVDAALEADLPFGEIDIIAGARYVVEVAGDLPYAELEAEAKYERREASVEADLPFADLDVLAEWPLAVFVDADLPGFDFDAQVKVPMGVLIDADLPGFDFDGSITRFYRIDLNAALPFADLDIFGGYPIDGMVEADMPGFDFDGLYRPYYEITGEGDFPFADLDGEARVFYAVEVSGDLPFADMVGEFETRYVATIDGDLPFADLSSDIEFRYYVQIEGDLPFADLDVSTEDKRNNRPYATTPSVGSSSGISINGGVVIGKTKMVRAG